MQGVRDEEQEKEKKERRLQGVRDEEQEKFVIRNGDSAIESKISQENCRAPSR